MMNIYKVERTDNVDYDEYDSFVVVAENDQIARNTHPEGPRNGRRHQTWPVDPEDLIVTLIGQVTSGIDGVVCASFNAG